MARDSYPSLNASFRFILFSFTDDNVPRWLFQPLANGCLASEPLIMTEDGSSSLRDEDVDEAPTLNPSGPVRMGIPHACLQLFSFFPSPFHSAVLFIPNQRAFEKRLFLYVSFLIFVSCWRFLSSRFCFLQWKAPSCTVE